MFAKAGKAQNNKSLLEPQLLKGEAGMLVLPGASTLTVPGLSGRAESERGPRRPTALPL